MVDIANIKPTDRTVDIVDPGTGLPLGIRVRVVSIDDDRLKRLKRQITDESLRLQSKGKSYKSEELERNSDILLFTASLGWEWFNPTGNEGDDGYDAEAAPSFEGEVPEFTQKNFLAVVRALPWFADQLRNEIDETKAFFGNSKPN